MWARLLPQRPHVNSQRYNKDIDPGLCPYLYSYVSYAKGRLVLTDALLL